MGWRRDLREADAVDLVLEALYQAAEEDSATGGPDLLRGIYPIVATITASNASTTRAWPSAPRHSSSACGNGAGAARRR